MVDIQNIPKVYGGMDETPLFQSDDEKAIRAHVERVIAQGEYYYYYYYYVDSCS